MQESQGPGERITSPGGSSGKSPKTISPRTKSRFEIASRQSSGSQEWSPQPSPTEERQPQDLPSVQDLPSNDQGSDINATKAPEQSHGATQHDDKVTNSLQMGGQQTSSVMRDDMPFEFRDPSGSAMMPVVGNATQNAQVAVQQSTRIRTLERDLESKSQKLEEAEAHIAKLDGQRDKSVREVMDLKHLLENALSENKHLIDRAALADKSDSELLEADKHNKAELDSTLNALSDKEERLQGMLEAIGRLQRDLMKAKVDRIDLERKLADSRSFAESYHKKNTDLIGQLDEAGKAVDFLLEQQRELENDLWRDPIGLCLSSAAGSPREHGLADELGSDAFRDSVAGSVMSNLLNRGHSRTGSRVSGQPLSGAFGRPLKSALRDSTQTPSSNGESGSHIRHQSMPVPQKIEEENETFPFTAPPRRITFADDSVNGRRNVQGLSRDQSYLRRALGTSPSMLDSPDGNTEDKVQKAPMIDRKTQTGSTLVSPASDAPMEQTFDMSPSVSSAVEVKPLRVRPLMLAAPKSFQFDPSAIAESPPLPTAASGSEGSSLGMGYKDLEDDLRKWKAGTEVGIEYTPHESSTQTDLPLLATSVIQTTIRISPTGILGPSPSQFQHRQASSQIDAPLPVDSATQTTPTEVFTQKLPASEYQVSPIQIVAPSPAKADLPTLPASTYVEGEFYPDREPSIATSPTQVARSTNPKPLPLRALTRDTALQTDSDGVPQFNQVVWHGASTQTRLSVHCSPRSIEEIAHVPTSRPTSLLGKMMSIASQIGIPAVAIPAGDSIVSPEPEPVPDASQNAFVSSKHSSPVQVSPSPEYTSHRPRSLGRRFLLQTNNLEQNQSGPSFRDEEEAVSTPVGLDMPSPRQLLFGYEASKPNVLDASSSPHNPASKKTVIDDKQILPTSDEVQKAGDDDLRTSAKWLDIFKIPKLITSLRPSNQEETGKAEAKPYSIVAESNSDTNLPSEKEPHIRSQDSAPGEKTDGLDIDKPAVSQTSLGELQTDPKAIPSPMLEHDTSRCVSSSIDVPQSPGLRRRQTTPVVNAANPLPSPQTTPVGTKPKSVSERPEVAPQRKSWTFMEDLAQGWFTEKEQPRGTYTTYRWRRTRDCRKDSSVGSFGTSTMGGGGDDIWFSTWTWTMLVWIVILAYLSLQAYREKHEWLSANVSRMNQIGAARVGWLDNDWLDKLQYSVQQRFDTADWIYC